MSIEMDDIEQQDAAATAAADWFLRIEREEPALETLAAWQRWLELSPQHRAAYEATQRTWSALDHVSASRWEQTTQDGRISTVSFNRKSGIRNRTRRLVWAAAAVLGITTAVALLAVRATNDGAYRTKIETVVAEHRELTLPDRSRVLIGARSAIEIKLTARLREVRLISGEAFFSVAHDAARPFVVNAGASKVTALGTAFNVRRYGHAVAVEVAEGRVRLESATPSKSKTGAIAVLGKGEETVIDQRGAVQPVRTLPAESVVAWRSGRRSYIDEPLGLVIADLNRYSTRPVVVDDPALANLRITTTFFSDDWEGWLSTLASAAPTLEVREEADAMRIVSRTGGRLER